MAGQDWQRFHFSAKVGDLCLRERADRGPGRATIDTKEAHDRFGGGQKAVFQADSNQADSLALALDGLRHVARVEVFDHSVKVRSREVVVRADRSRTAEHHRRQHDLIAAEQDVVLTVVDRQALLQCDQVRVGKFEALEIRDSLGGFLEER